MTQILSPSTRRRFERERTQKICAFAAVLTIIFLVLPLFIVFRYSNPSEDVISKKSNVQSVPTSTNRRLIDDRTEQDTVTTITDPDFTVTVKVREDGTLQQKKLRKRRMLPTFDNGGVIVFFNIVSSGGSAIREFVQQKVLLTAANLHTDTDTTTTTTTNTIIRFERMYNPDTAVQYEDDIHKELTSKRSDTTSNKTILFVEISGDVPGFVYWQRKLNRFREHATSTDKSFFSFTILREPVSFHTSYFNSYKLEPCIDTDEDSLCEQTLIQSSDVTENALVDGSIPNHQCLWLARLSHNPYRQETCVTNEECRGTYSYMKDHLDWIGVTEEIQTVTIPLLSHLLSSSDKKAGNNNIQYKPTKTETDKVGQLDVTKLSKSTITTLLERSAGDADVYVAVKRDYDIFSNFFYNYNPTKNSIVQS